MQNLQKWEEERAGLNKIRCWFRNLSLSRKAGVVLGVIVMLTSLGPHSEIVRPWQLGLGLLMIFLASKLAHR